MLLRSEILPYARAAVVVALVLTACRDSTGPIPEISLPDVWNLVGYSDHGIAAEEITGTMSFESNGRFVTAGTLPHPGEPQNVVNASGTYVDDAVAARLSLTTSDGTTLWTMKMAGDTLILTLVQDPEVPPPSVVKLLRWRGPEELHQEDDRPQLDGEQFPQCVRPT